MKFWLTITLVFVGILLPSSTDILYYSTDYTLYPDRVVQGKYEAKAISQHQIISTYKSPAKTNFSSTIEFKFAINGKDNEAPSGQDHKLTVVPQNGTFESPVIKFGEKDQDKFITEAAPKILPTNTEVTFRVDMSEVFQQFESKGYYTNWSGERIYESDFRGLYIAGGSSPLSWDFDNLTSNSEYKLIDEDNDRIYEVTFVFNPYDPFEQENKVWELKNEINQYPQFESHMVLIDGLYNMALDETQMLKEADGTFRTGAKWEGVWTRDISYSVLLSYAMLEPEVSKKSLLRKVNNDRIIQDTGSGGAWPVSTDRIVWSLAAWELYKVTGDDEWLRNSYRIIKNTIEDDLANYILDERFGLFKGESSFLDWREQSYPEWMDNVDISQSITLGTNAGYYQTMKILSEMASHLNKPSEQKKYSEYANKVKRGINTYLWNQEKGYYNQYLYGRYYMSSSPRFEALGNALAVLFDIADEEKATRITSEAPFIPFGTPTIYPQIPNIPPYHNNGIWPFVQAYWNLSSAKVKNEHALSKGLASLFRPAALFLTNKENMVAQNGDYADTQINSDRQLWSVAGNLAMFYRVFLGLNFESDHIHLSPIIPKSYSGVKKVSGFTYRDAKLDFIIQGYGDSIKSMKIDGKQVKNFQVPGNLTGNHTIEIEMSSTFSKSSSINEVDNRFSPVTPRLTLSHNNLNWVDVGTEEVYEIFRNGKKIAESRKAEFSLNGQMSGNYQVQIRARNGDVSFLSEPALYFSDKDEIAIEIEDFTSEKSSLKTEHYSGTGAVEVSTIKNRNISIPIEIEEAGNYLFNIRYSNGSGPWNTDNNCAIRTLKVNKKTIGTIILPQRGIDEWSNWGASNQMLLSLDEGQNFLEIVYTVENRNMDGQINQAMLDKITLFKVPEL